MKKLTAAFLLLCIIMSGCTVRFSAPDGDGGTDTADEKDRYAVTEADSTANLDVYPENCRDTLIGKFDRYQYSRLSDEQKRIYILLDNAVYSMTTGYIGLGKCTERDVTLAYYALRNDRPEYFWLPSSYLFTVNDRKISVCFAEDESDWLFSASERGKYEEKIRRYIEDFIDGTKDKIGEYEKELSAHDAVAADAVYDFDAVADIENHPCAWTVVGAFADGKVVCTGYAKAMQMLCLAQGIDCITVTGTTDEPHMWNCVRIDGKWYHADVTADDSNDSGYHSFFNVTDDYIGLGCRIDPDFVSLSDEELRDDSFNMNIPECRSLDANYFHVNSIYITNLTQIEPTLISEVCAAVRSGRKRVEICLDPKLGFIAGKTEYDGFADVEECLVSANAELGDGQKIKRYSVSGLDRSTCITVSWK